MSETAFTPGPWNACKGISETDEMRCGVTVSRSKIEYLVATIENGAPGDFCETEYANARLIAAAPDLYEALNAIMADPRGRGIDPEHRRQAYAALAKAASTPSVSVIAREEDKTETVG